MNHGFRCSLHRARRRVVRRTGKREDPAIESVRIDSIDRIPVSEGVRIPRLANQWVHAQKLVSTGVVVAVVQDPKIGWPRAPTATRPGRPRRSRWDAMAQVQAASAADPRRSHPIIMALRQGLLSVFSCSGMGLGWRLLRPQPLVLFFECRVLDRCDLASSSGSEMNGPRRRPPVVRIYALWDLRESF